MCMSHKNCTLLCNWRWIATKKTILSLWYRYPLIKTTNHTIFFGGTKTSPFFSSICNCLTQEENIEANSKRFTQTGDSQLYVLICIGFSWFGFLMLPQVLCVFAHWNCNQYQIKLKHDQISREWLQFQRTIHVCLCIINLSWKSLDLTQSTIKWESANRRSI